MPSPEDDRRPSAIVWLLAVLSLLMPAAGVGLGLYGAYLAFSGSAWGWLLLAAGIGILIVDLLVDLRWSYGMKSSEPDLNRRGEQLIGQVATIIEPISGGGRGSVRIGDGVWTAEGIDAGAGAKVRVTGCKGTVLTIEAQGPACSAARPAEGRAE